MAERYLSQAQIRASKRIYKSKHPWDAFYYVIPYKGASKYKIKKVVVQAISRTEVFNKLQMNAYKHNKRYPKAPQWEVGGVSYGPRK